MLAWSAGESLIAGGSSSRRGGGARIALDFFRSVGATYFVERGERLLAKIA